MARLTRLVVAGQAHLVIQRGHNGMAVFVDAADRKLFHAALCEAALAERVLLHAYALLDLEVQLLATPPEAAALGRMVQAVGRRYVGAFNRRHQRQGTLWDGRFRSAVVEPGSMRLTTLRAVDGAGRIEWGSAAHRIGGPRDPCLVDPPEYWELGNTPFEREAAYRALLERALAASIVTALRSAALGGWVAGSAAFAAGVAEVASRPARPRSAGRPRRLDGVGQL